MGARVLINGTRYYSIETPLALIGPAHFSISVSTNFCRYSGELRSRATRSAPISCIRVFTAGVLMVASGRAARGPMGVTHVHFSTDHQIARGLSNVPATVILFIHFGLED